WVLGGGVGVAISLQTPVGLAAGVSVAVNEISNTITAYVDNSKITAAGDVLIKANAESDIQAITVGVALAVTAGTGGLAGSGAGAGSGNTIKNTIHAYIANSQGASNQGVYAGRALTVSAVDDTKIIAGAGALGFSVAVGGKGGVGVSIGASVTRNHIENSVKAYVANATARATGANLDVTAAETAEIDAISVAGSVAIGGGTLVGVAGAGAGGDAKNTVRNTVAAYAQSSTLATLNSGHVRLMATDDADVNAINVAGAVSVAASAYGSASIAIGASIANNDVQNTVRAYSQATTITSAGSVVVTAASTADLHAVSVAVSLAAAVAIGSLALSGGGAESTNTVSNTIEAYIQGTSAAARSTTTAANSITVAATEDATIVSRIVAVAGAGGIAGGSVGVSVSSNTVTSSVKAYVQNANLTATGGNISIGATTTDDVDTLSVATSIAVTVGGAGAGGDARANVSPTVESFTGSATTLQAGGSVTVSATTTNTAEAETYGAAGGLVAVGASTADAKASGSVKAHIDGVISGAGSVTVRAAATNTADAMATGLAGGAISAAGAGAKATIKPSVEAYAAGGNVTTSGAMRVEAKVTPKAKAWALGVAVGAAAGVGGSEADAIVAPTVNAFVGGAGITIQANSLTIAAIQSLPSGGTSADAKAIGASGGVFLAVNASVSRAANGNDDGQAAYRSYVADNTTLHITGATAVTVNSNSKQQSVADNFNGGILAAGAGHADARSKTLNEAYLGQGVTLTGGSLLISSYGSDDNFAQTMAGAVGAVSGAGSKGTTNTTSTTTAKIRNSDGVKKIDLTQRGSGAAQIVADHTATVNGQQLTFAGAVLAGTGAEVTNDVDSTVEAGVGNNVVLWAKSIDIGAVNHIIKPKLSDYVNAADPDKTGPNVLGATGGLASAAGATSKTNITFNTKVVVGTNSKLEVKGRPTRASKLYLHALNDFNATDKVTLATGGALAGAGGRTEIKTLADHAKVEIGTGAQLKSVGEIEISARGQGTVFAAIATDTYGAGTVAFSYSVADIRPVNTVFIGQNTLVRAAGDLKISAGTDTNFNRDQYKITARTDTFAGSAIPIYDVDATANLIQDNKITISAGAVLETERNASLHAERFGFADMTAYAKATTWLSAIADAISGSSFNKGTLKAEAHGTVENNGTIRTGINRQKFLTLDSWDSRSASGNPTVSASVQSEGVNFNVTLEKLESTLVRELRNAKAQLAIFINSGNQTLINYYQAEINRLQAELDALGLLDQPTSNQGTPPPNVKEQYVLTVTVEDVWAQAGIIDVRADVLQGTDGLFDAPGDAKVVIHNSTPAFLKLKRITIPETNGGLFFNGEAADNDRINQLNDPDDGVPLGEVRFQRIALPGAGMPPVIEIKNTFNPLTYSNPNFPDDEYPPPNIEIIGSLDEGGILRGIDNLGGNVSLLIQGGKGSIIIGAPVRAKNLSVVTGGDVFINGVTQYAVGGDPLSHWRSVALTSQASYPTGADGVYGTGDEADPDAVNAIVNQSLGGNSTIQIFTITAGVQPADNIVNKFDGVFTGSSFTYRVELKAGNQYFIRMKQLGINNNLDPFLTLRDADNNFLASDNNSGGGQDNQDALIIFTPATTGTYQIIAGGTGSGQFTVEVSTGIRMTQALILPYATAGTFDLTFNGRTAADIPYNVTAQDLRNRLNASLGLNFAVTGTGSAGDPFIITVLSDFNNYAPMTADISNLQGAVSLYGDRIFITANYLNVNGVMQSGKADYILNIGQAAADEIDNLKRNGATGMVVLHSVTNNDFVVRYDTFYNRIQIEEVKVSGGYIEIHGHVVNTGKGEIRLLGGYGNIQINNTTNYDIVLKRLDASQRGAGKLILRDKAYGPAYVTLYEKAGGSVTKTVDDGTNPPTVTGNVGDTPTYQPLPNYRYGWSVSQARYERTRTLYGTSAWLDIDALAADPDNIVEGPFVEKVGQPVIAGTGPYYYLPAAGAPEIGKDYTYSYVNHNVGDAQTYVVERYTESTWYGKKTHYVRTVTERKQEELHTHTIRADRPIGIKFIGGNEGTIVVNSAAGILIDGPIQNPSGVTSLTAGTTIKQLSDLGYVNGRRVDLAAGTGIGTDAVGLNTQVAERAPNDFDSTKLLVALVTGDKVKNVATNTVYRFLGSPQSVDFGQENFNNSARWAVDTGDFKYTTDANRTRVVPGNQVLVVQGHTAGGEVGSVYRYLGTTPALLDLSTQNYTSASWQKVSFFASFEATSTAGNIHVRQIAGALPIDKVVAGPEGNVTITAQNSITVAELSAGTFAEGRVGQGTTAAPNGSIVLTALNGGIGGEGRPITLYAGTRLKDTVSATASGSIYLRSGTFSAAAKAAEPRAGDLRIKKIESTSRTGLIHVEVADGALIDANNEQVVDQRTRAELANGLWHDLQLTDVLTPVVAGDHVQLANGYSHGGVPGSIYRYVGPRQELNLGTQDYSNGALWQLVGHRYTTSDGVVSLAANDRVLVALTYRGGGVPGRIYRYL
ncbi:MAG: pre-peptidase C-terminal domain-containing protein, partial [Gemmataceae bacterium]|nr:pre-peptidase C-terminal domain-containing protein [Gemmataceae bacterium]